MTGNNELFNSDFSCIIANDTDTMKADMNKAVKDWDKKWAKQRGNDRQLRPRDIKEAARRQTPEYKEAERERYYQKKLLKSKN